MHHTMPHLRAPSAAARLIADLGRAQGTAVVPPRAPARYLALHTPPAALALQPPVTFAGLALAAITSAFPAGDRFAFGVEVLVLRVGRGREAQLGTALPPPLREGGGALVVQIRAHVVAGSRDCQPDLMMGASKVNSRCVLAVAVLDRHAVLARVRGFAAVLGTVLSARGLAKRGHVLVAVLGVAAIVRVAHAAGAEVLVLGSVDAPPHDLGGHHVRLDDFRLPDAEGGVVGFALREKPGPAEAFGVRADLAAH